MLLLVYESCLQHILFWFQPKPFDRSASVDRVSVTWRDLDGGEQTALQKQRVSFIGVYVWGVNSTVTKHSDYFVWKDTSERVARCCDDTSGQQASEFLCTQTPLWGSPATKTNAQKPQKYSLRHATNVTLSNFCGWRRKTKIAGFWKPCLTRF